MRSRALLVLGVFTMGALSAAAVMRASHESASAQETGASATARADAARLEQEIEQLKGRASDQAHVMTSVAYHFNNLWFAGQHENWPLAEFYLNETRSHLRWAVRVIPVRKDSAGQEIQLGAILEALENTQLGEIRETITKKDRGEFEHAYRTMLDGCNSCHKATEKNYIHVQVPGQPAESLMAFDPETVDPEK